MINNYSRLYCCQAKKDKMKNNHKNFALLAERGKFQLKNYFHKKNWRSTLTSNLVKNT